ncbi:MAG: DUF4159 domain-containing protein [Myxococcales bacterium]|nr:DUF4159 domain-containing protein [Myxococcales bacterium]
MNKSDSCARWTRRQLLLAAALGTGATLFSSPKQATAIGDLSKIKLARLRYQGGATSRASSLFVWSQQIRQQTSVDTSLEVHEIGLLDKDLFRFPFITMVGDRGFLRFPARHSERLKLWLEAGGTLFVDNVGPMGPSDSFDLDFRAEMERIFPRTPINRISPEHVLYRSFYRLDYPAGRLIARPFLEGITLDKRLAVIYSQNDITGALSQDTTGQWEYDCRPGGESQRSMALRMAVNIVEYVLCQDYKDDQVHLDYLLHKRNWKIKVNKEPN